jgi:hypothetical protein
MRTSKYSEEQIIEFFKQARPGCRSRTYGREPVARI